MEGNRKRPCVGKCHLSELESWGGIFGAKLGFRANTLESNLGEPEKLRRSSVIYTVRPERK